MLIEDKVAYEKIQYWYVIGLLPKIVYIRVLKINDSFVAA